MSVEQTQVIDVVSKDKRGHIVLTISDHLDWTNMSEHVHVLQQKIETYLRFLESGEIYKKYPKASNCPIEIEIMLHYSPSLEADSHLARLQSAVENSGYGFRIVKFSATPYTN
ncbi:MAG: hypothetical protein HYX26_03410 [Acidobacteriales bacterium]|nr:hypothetical protein [Terriglobales bacterium]